MEQTIVKPTPGGRAPAPKPQSEKSADNTVVISKSPELVNNDSVVAYGNNPLLAEANGLLSIIGQIRATATHSDPLFLKETLAQKLRDYENRLRHHDVDLDTIDTARYCLCCSLDEAVLNTNWGGIHFGAMTHCLVLSMPAARVGKRSLSTLISAWRNQIQI